MGAIPAPASLPPTTRISPVELTTYVVDATLIKYRFTDDSDYHLVLADAAGRTMIAELPHPDCVGAASPFKGAITAVRATFDAQLRAGTTFKSVAIPVRIHGIGFWDSIHGQTGVAPNGIELHPVLRLEFNPVGPQGSVVGYPLVTDSDRLFNWAEAAYPDYFPKPGTAGTFERYTYRYYAKTGNYVATAGGRVIVHNGKDWNLLDVGSLADFMAGAAAAGF